MKTGLFKYVILILLISGCGKRVENFTITDKIPEIFPDYKGIVIPPNIENGTNCLQQIKGTICM